MIDTTAILIALISLHAVAFKIHIPSTRFGVRCSHSQLRLSAQIDNEEFSDQGTTLVFEVSEAEVIYGIHVIFNCSVLNLISFKAGQRLDRFLSGRVPEQSRSYLASLCAEGLVMQIPAAGSAEGRALSKKSAKVFAGENLAVTFAVTDDLEVLSFSDILSSSFPRL